MFIVEFVGEQIPKENLVQRFLMISFLSKESL